MDIALIAALTAPQAMIVSAYADVGTFLSEYKLVKQFCYTSSGDYLAVGLVTEPMFTLSGITEYTRLLEKELEDRFGFKEVAVTFDTDLVYRIKKLGETSDEATVTQIIEAVRKRR